MRYCCKNSERVKKIHMNAERCIADNARIPSDAFHPMQCEAGGRVLHWMQCITRDVCNISNTPRGMNVYFLYSRAILAAKTLLLKIGMNKTKKSHLSFHNFFSKKVMHWGFYVPHFHFTNFFKKVMYWIHYIDFFKKSDALNPLHRVLWMRWSRDITKVDVMISLHQLFAKCIKYYTKRRLFSEIPII